MKAALLRIGIDSGSGGIQGPLFKDGRFEYIPVPDMTNNYGVDERTYGNTFGKYGKKLIEYFPKSKQNKMNNCSIHFDPEFESFTYGDPTSTKSGLKKMQSGDLLIFYCGLEGYGFSSEPALYIIGYFIVEFAGTVGELGETKVRRFFSKNFHVKHKIVYEKQKDRLVLVKGNQESRLLSKAHKISTYSKDKSGRKLKVLSKEAQKIFGDFQGKISIQRCPPRWIDEAYLEKTKNFLYSAE